MSLAFGGECDFDDIGAPRRAFAPRLRPPPPWTRTARDSRAKNKAPMLNVSPETIRSENASIAAAFSRIADRVGLADDERAILCGGGLHPSRMILALETLGAALDLFGAPEATRAWLRAEIFESPFNGRAPLTLFAIDGKLGVEIALLHLRARLRRAHA